MLGKAVNAVNIVRWVAAGKGYPNKVINVLRKVKAASSQMHHQWHTASNLSPRFPVISPV
jgi:hypothetical protein